MAATFSLQQYTGTAGTSGATYGSGNVVNFFRVEATGTTNYNNTASNIQAGSNSFPIWLKGRWSNSGAASYQNVKYWRFTDGSGTAFDANTGSMNIMGTVQAGYTQPTGTGTATNQASNVNLPTSGSTTAPGGALNPGSTSQGGAGSVAVPSFIVKQLTTASDAPAGDTGLAGFTWQWDEN